jgi:hypothetical protein
VEFLQDAFAGAVVKAPHTSASNVSEGDQP